MFQLNSKMILAIVVYMGWIAYYSMSSYVEKKNTLMEEFDRRLVDSAMTLPLMMRDGFHRESMNGESVTKGEDEENRKRLSQFAEVVKIQYIYSLIQKGDKILFSASSATQEELRTGENISYYFSEYSDAPKEIREALGKNQIQFAEYGDKWGNFRSVFVPLYAEDGSKYLVCTDIEISHIDSILKDAMVKNIVQSLLFLLFIVPFILAYNWQILFSNQSLQKAKEEIELANNQLKEHQNFLEHTVKERTEELESINNKLKVLSHIDSLTNIPNRRAYTERLEMEIEEALRSDTPIALLVIDIDYFKSYNDNYGHSEGDEVLCKVARSLSESLPHSIDFVARFGGEEFVTILPATDLQDAYIIAKHIQSNISALAIPHHYAKEGSILSVSIGCSSLEGEDIDAVNLFKQADAALYMAKEKGRNRVEVFGNYHFD